MGSELEMLKYWVGISGDSWWSCECAQGQWWSHLDFFCFSFSWRKRNTRGTLERLLTKHSFSDCIYGLLYEMEILSNAVSSGVIGPRRESTVNILNGHGITLTSYELLWHPQISTSQTFIREVSFFRRQWLRQTHHGQYTENRDVRGSSPEWDIWISHPPPKDQGSHVEERLERL